MGKYNGIDVSKWNGTIDWAKVKAAGIDFAFIRAGYCGYAGSIVQDTMFEANMKGAIAAGIDVGVYLYSYAKTAAAAKVAASEMVSMLATYKLTYPVAFDIEDAVNVAMSKAENTTICKAFLSAIAEAGYHPLLYTYKAFAESYLTMSDLPYDFWLAHVGTNGVALSSTNYTGDYTVWQYSWVGSVNGISGDVDLNYCYKDYSSTINTTDTEQKDEIEEEPEEDVELESAGTTYKVAKNDNLTNIAKKYAVPLRSLIHANQTVTNSVTGKSRKLNPDLIYIGDVLTIPTKP